MAEKSPTILFTGGGSGGHITPLIAVAHELKAARPNVQIIYIGNRGDALGSIIKNHDTFASSHLIFAGKFRRYHSEGIKQLLDIKTLFFNIRDVLYLGIGILQACYLVLNLKPTCIFIKGGFVGVPIGLAAALFKVPFVTHDSDAIPGLANRIVGRWATAHATGMPAELYPYPKQKTEYTGVPVQVDFQPVSHVDQAHLKSEIGIPANSRLVFVTGGGLGAARLNDAIVAIAPKLLGKYQDVYIVQSAGHANYKKLVSQYNEVDQSIQQRIIVKDFITNLHAYSGAADIVVMRASATSMAEMAVQGKACILVPNPLLTGGHQTKNATAYAKEDAACVVTESDIEKKGSVVLLNAIERLLENSAERNEYSLNIAKFAHPEAAQALAVLLIKAGGI